MRQVNAAGLACFFWIATLLAVPSEAFAHPHVWVDYYVDTVGGKDGITKLKFRWHFDDMFTSMVKEDFHIRTVTPENVATLRDGAFANLKNYHYYTYIKVDGQEFDPTQISDFGAAMKGLNLEYTFTINLPHPAKKLELALYDPEFYVDIGPPIEKMSPDAPGIMATTSMKPKEFLSTSAEPGANPPSCEWHQGQPRVSATWGKFAMFTVTCEAK
jgi:hypothetical protein